MANKQSSTDAVLLELRAFGLAYPGAHTKSPWPGHLDLAVNDKTFAYLSLEGEPLTISCKLPESHPLALMFPYAQPTAYGLGRSGWVTASFESHKPDVELLKSWIDESYRAQAPKRLVRQLASGATSEAAAKTTRKKTAKKKPAKKASKKVAKKASKRVAKKAPATRKPSARKKASKR